MKPLKHECEMIEQVKEIWASSGIENITITYENPFINKDYSKEWIMRIYNKTEWCGCEGFVTNIKYCPFCGKDLRYKLEI